MSEWLALEQESMEEARRKEGLREQNRWGPEQHLAGI